MEDPNLLLKTWINKKIRVKCKDTAMIEGILHAFDEHQNILVQETTSDNELMFIRGETVVFLMP